MKCIYCNLVNNKNEKLFIKDYDNALVYLCEDQYFSGWTLVIIKRHYDNYFEIPPDERRKLESVVGKVSNAITNLFKPDHINYAIFGNIIRHVHWNVIPRYKNDGLWGGPPWPHNERRLDEHALKELVEKMRSVL